MNKRGTVCHTYKRNETRSIDEQRGMTTDLRKTNTASFIAEDREREQIRFLRILASKYYFYIEEFFQGILGLSVSEF